MDTHTSAQHHAPSKLARAKMWLRATLKEWWRVLKVTKKPGREEFLTITKVSGFGMLAVGFIGFLIHMIKELLF